MILISILGLVYITTMRKLNYAEFLDSEELRIYTIERLPLGETNIEQIRTFSYINGLRCESGENTVNGKVNELDRIHIIQCHTPTFGVWRNTGNLLRDLSNYMSQSKWYNINFYINNETLVDITTSHSIY
jgi:thioredoxin-related protein